MCQFGEVSGQNKSSKMLYYKDLNLVSDDVVISELIYKTKLKIPVSREIYRDFIVFKKVKIATRVAIINTLFKNR